MTNTVWFHLYEANIVVKFVETSRNGDCQGLGEERTKCYSLTDAEFQFLKMNKILEMDGDLVSTHSSIVYEN